MLDLKGEKYMISNNDDLKQYFKSLRTGDYQRDDFDTSLKKVGFSFTLPAIHIAGTNGKGTTGTIIRNIYQEEGYKVGHFHSPYLYSADEMIVYDNENISLSEINEIITANDKLIKKYDLSEFEVQTFIAFSYFLKVKPDLVIIECGMGGLDDATNIFKPILSIITSISLEHTSYLGSSLTEIAYHKAGIIKKDVPVLLGDVSEEGLDVIKNVARETKSKIFSRGRYLNEIQQSDGYSFTFKPYDNLKIHSLALFSVIDASIALSACEIIKEQFPLHSGAIYRGIENTSLPGRMEVVKNSPLVIVDGAHNQEAIHRLVESLEKLEPAKDIHVVFASFRDKNIHAMLAELNFISNDINLTTFDNVRARKEDEYFLFLDEFPFNGDYRSLIEQKMREFPEDIIVITGSLAFSGLISKEFKEGLIK